MNKVEWFSIDKVDAPVDIGIFMWIPDIGARPVVWSKHREIWVSTVDIDVEYIGENEPTHWTWDIEGP